jgi:uncharacterized alpha-E superfamily protein
MLSRVADSLYWMSRYLERAEHTARLLDVNLNLSLEQLPGPADKRWLRVLAALHETWPGSSPIDAYHVANTLTFDQNNVASIVSCIASARENARQVREQISSEMWEHLNQLFLRVRATSIDQIWNFQPWEYYRAIKDGSHLFQGITDSTLSHGEGWLFIELGRFIERAVSLVRLLDVHFEAFTDSIPTAQEYLEWIGLLKSCTAFEAYCKVYTADVRPDRVAEFLLLNAQFPHSVCFSIDCIQSALEKIAEANKMRKSGRVNRVAGRLSASVEFSQIDEVMAVGFRSYLAEIQRQCETLHDEIQQAYISYPIDRALAS